MAGQILDFNTARRQDELARTGIDAADIRERLHASPKAFIDWLYSGRAYISRNQARVGNVYGEQGSSLAIDLATGLWKDHATDEGGDLISLYRAWRGHAGDANFELSLKEIAADFLGDKIEIIRPTWEPTPTARIAEQKVKLGDKPRDENLQLGAPVATYQYFDLHGKIIASVVRFEPNGRESKTFRPWCFKTVEGQQKWVMGAPDMRPLYRLPEVATAATVVLCEGEGCADALASVGIVATSAMQGAKAPIEKTDWTPLAGKTVIVWPDKDHPGFDYAHRVSERLLALGCKVLGVTPPESSPDKWDAADCVGEGGDPHGLIGAALRVTAKPQAAPSRFTFEKTADLRKLPPAQWLVKNWIPEGASGIFYGKWAAGKSFIGFDLALHLAYGLPEWHGADLPGQSQHVLVIAREGHQSFVNRVDAFKNHHGLCDDSEHLTFMRASVSFMRDEDFSALLDAIRASGTPYKLIIVDTVARVLPGVDMNEQQTVTTFMERISVLGQVTAASTIGMHHQNKSGGMMGSAFFEANSDFVFEISRDGEDGPLTSGEITCTKMKDAEDGWKRSVSYTKVLLSVSPDGPSSLVVQAIEKQDSASKSTGTLPDKETCRRVLHAIREAWLCARPWSNSPQTKSEGRFAARIMTAKFGFNADSAQYLIDRWLMEGVLSVEMVNAKSKQKGLKVVGTID